MAANTSDKEGYEVPLTVLVDKERNKVVYAESGKDFVDVLLSFLTLPLGTIARLVAEESNIEAVKFGSLSKLYRSVSELDEKYLWSQTCKRMLLKPRNSMEDYSKKMKLNVDQTESLMFFSCEDNNCKRENGYHGSTLRDQKCICGKMLNVAHKRNSTAENGFVNETSTFIISDDLSVMPNILETSLKIFQKLGINDIDVIDKQIVHFSKKEVIDLLKLSLISKTPLSDFIFKKGHLIGNLDPRNRLDFWIGEVEEPCDEYNMVVKVVRRKSNEQILFVEGNEDFADFVFSFLTLPMGGVVLMFEGLSFLNCLDNLYNSMNELSPGRCFRSQSVKDKLIDFAIGMQFELRNQILPIGVEPFHYSLTYKNQNIVLNLVDPKSPISGGFAKGPMSFMVTDDLVVSPMSSISGLEYLERMKVPLNDVEERVISIGLKEGLSILKASLTSTSCLINGLSLSITQQFLF